MKHERFDVIVVGGGHAGVEAAAAAARMGARVALVTFDAGAIGAMSCNPAIGGLGKGHLVREVDALDGIIARAADDAAIHYRMLNRSKGSAVWGPRIQADRDLFRASVQRQVRSYPNLTMIESGVERLLIDGAAARGVELTDGAHLFSPTVVICTGTFLGGRLFRGEYSEIGGRVGERSATTLAAQFRDIGFPMSRLKTGTPPRLDGRSIDWSKLGVQASDGESWRMSALTRTRRNAQLFCAIARTKGETHDIIRRNLDRSPLYSGAIEGLGPRYCPSIEDKIARFGDRDGHQVFLEPEGLASALVYPNGISTSLPAEVQQEFLRSMAGLEQVDIVTPGYAVEYDHIDPRALGAGLEVRSLEGLYCAGQINGTTGYEEAAAQGLVAGLSAASRALGREQPVFHRSNSYIGVMIDDLTLQGVTEPYRMLTSRAEHRLSLRAFNADTRLTALGIEWGCVSEERAEVFRKVNEERLQIEAHLSDGDRRKIASGTVDDDLVGRMNGIGFDPDVSNDVIEGIRYRPYVERQAREVRDLAAATGDHIPDALNYAEIPGLSLEMVERLGSAQPQTMAQASRVRGVTPAALAAILVQARRKA